jgi:hypothetical protein
MPVIQRHAGSLSGGNELVGRKSKLIVVDDIGLFVFYDHEDELQPENVRKSLIGEREGFAYVEADTPEQAVEKFWQSWEAANCGGTSQQSKALRIDKTKPILLLPNCARLRLEPDGSFLCGRENIEDDEKELGGCVLDGYDLPFFECPIASFLSRLSIRPEAFLTAYFGDGYVLIQELTGKMAAV